MKKLLLFLVLISYGLVAQTPIWHYTFDGNSAPVDSQGNFGGTLIKLSGGTPDPSNYGVDRFGNTASSLVCNGTSMDMMYQGVLGNLPQGSSARSFSFWVRFKSNGDQHVFRYGNYLNQEEITFYKPQSGGTTIVRTGPSFLNVVYHANNQIAIINTDDSLGWHHYVMVIDGNQAIFYRNGVLLGNTTFVGGINTTGTTLRFASSTPTSTANAASTNNFLLDDFKVYDQALSHTQIKQMFADEIAFNSNNLVAYYGFENTLNCANNSLYDLSAFASTPFVSGVIGQGRNIVGGAALHNSNVGADIDKSSYTIMYWEKQNADDVPSNYATTLELNGGQYLRRRYDNTYLGFASDATTWHETLTSRPSLNTWIHHSVTVRNINGIFHSLYYRNGELMTITPSNNTTTQIHSFVNKLVLGGGIDANGDLMFSKNVADISLDEVYIYNRELNQSEILSTMYRTTAPTFSSCPTGDVTLTTQAEVDALASCTTISGFLNVNANNAALDLSPLNNITTINGALTVQGLTNNQLNIFPNLTTVTGSIQIRSNTFTEFSGFNSLTTASNGLQVLQNTNLTSFSGFNSLSFINGSNLGILLNNNLATINAFSNLQNVQGLLIRNTQITNLSFLSSLTGNGGQLSIESNPLLTSANFINPVSHCFCTGISGGDYVRIQNNPLLTTVGNVTLQTSVLGQPTIEFFQINNNPLLSSVGMSLDASATSSSVVGNLNINNNPALLNLNFLNNINVISCATLNISSMPISSLASLTSLTSVGTIQITGNTNLTDISALNNINIGNITSLLISVNPMLSTCAVDWVCDYLATSSPNVAISGNATGCESVAAVNTACAALSTSVFDLASMSLYPNPTDAIFSIVVPNEVVKQVRIFDVTGKMLLDTQQTTINVSSFSSGIYLINIETESGKMGVSKLVKR